MNWLSSGYWILFYLTLLLILIILILSIFLSYYFSVENSYIQSDWLNFELRVPYINGHFNFTWTYVFKEIEINLVQLLIFVLGNWRVLTNSICKTPLLILRAIIAVLRIRTLNEAVPKHSSTTKLKVRSSPRESLSKAIFK